MSATAAVSNTADHFNSPTMMENDDGSLSAPIMYASVVMGMITMWAEKKSDAKQAPGGEGSEDEPVLAGAKAATKDRTAWDERVCRTRQRADHTCHCLEGMCLWLSLWLLKTFLAGPHGRARQHRSRKWLPVYSSIWRADRTLLSADVIYPLVLIVRREKNRL